jgi:ABC-type nitrate/sulfonate/bicarbonate transport system permease component
MFKGFFKGFFEIRNEPTRWGRLLMGLSCIGLLALAWFLATRDWYGPEGAERLIDRYTLGSPEEVFGTFGVLWFDRAFLRNLLWSLLRLIEGFGLAVIVGVPLGILCGSFKRIEAFFMPLSVFGRNIPISTLLPVTLVLFGMGEKQKVFFYFIATVAFIMFDVARAISEVKDDYLDTAYTLGANRKQVLVKVMVPLAMPDIINSIRLLFGLAFGYVVLAEGINPEYGVGFLIDMTNKKGPREHVWLILILVTLVAYLMDRLFFLLQKRAFAYRYQRR